MNLISEHTTVSLKEEHKRAIGSVGTWQFPRELMVNMEEFIRRRNPMNFESTMENIKICCFRHRMLIPLLNISLLYKYCTDSIHQPWMPLWAITTEALNVKDLQDEIAESESTEFSVWD